MWGITEAAFVYALFDTDKCVCEILFVQYYFSSQKNIAIML